VFVAARFGLVALIASGYRWIAIVILTVYILPLVTWGLWRILRAGDVSGEAIALRSS
jgi:hypothetical protein